jgi:hypothetical protein
MRGTFSKTISSGGSSRQASSISQTPRSVRRLSAWYLSVLLLRVSASRPEKPLHGADRKTMCGRSPAGARWMSCGVQLTPAGGRLGAVEVAVLVAVEQVEHGAPHAGQALEVAHGRARRRRFRRCSGTFRPCSRPWPMRC